MENKIIITERNRDRAKIWLEKVNGTEDTYTIRTTKDKQYCLNHACMNYKELPIDADDYDGLIEPFKKVLYMSYDPAGGPYMAIGCQIGKYKLTRIFVRNDELYFRLSEDENNPITYEDVCKYLFEEKHYSHLYDNGIDTPFNGIQDAKIKAFRRLTNIAEYLNDDWYPNWNDKDEDKFIISYANDEYIATSTETSFGMPVFKTYDLAKKAILIMEPDYLNVLFK